MKRSGSWPVVATFVVIMLEIVGAIFLSTLTGQGPGSDATAYATVLFVLTTSVVGTLIGLRRPGNTIGWLLRVAAFGFATGSLLVTYVEVAVAQAGLLTGWPDRGLARRSHVPIGLWSVGYLLATSVPDWSPALATVEARGLDVGTRHGFVVLGGPVRPGRFRGTTDR